MVLFKNKKDIQEQLEKEIKKEYEDKISKLETKYDIERRELENKFQQYLREESRREFDIRKEIEKEVSQKLKFTEEANDKLQEQIDNLKTELIEEQQKNINLQLKLSEMITANYNLLNIKEKNGK
jgi:hypothetical protein